LPSSSGYVQYTGGNHYATGGAYPGGQNTNVTWGNPDDPFTYGGGGGDVGFAAKQGQPNGGGIVRLATPGTLDLQGPISVNGLGSMDQQWTGGGAGGSIYIDAGTLTSTNNSGSLSAVGATVADTLGGGAGGLIRVYTTSGSHTGTITHTAVGGAGTWSGGAAPGLNGLFNETTCAGTYLSNGYCAY